jgi:hypothetical protein
MSDEAKKQPLGTFKDGAVTVKLWEQNAKGDTYINASIGKLYKDDKTGQWKESRSFNETDLLKLQAMLPEVRQEIQQWQDYFRSVPLPEQQHHQQRQQTTQQRETTTQPEQRRNLAEQRDTVMQNSQRNRDNTPTHAPQRQPGRDRSR